MGIATTVAESLHKSMQGQARPATWVARAAGVPYKRVLAEVVHRTAPLKLDTAVAVAEALGVELPLLIPTPDEQAAAA